MKNFILGFLFAGWLARNTPFLISVLEKWVAKLELKRDILKHDNPDLGN